MATSRPRTTVTLDVETYRQIECIAKKEDKSNSEVMRNLLEGSLNAKICEENIDYLSTIMRKQLRDILKPYMERITSLEAKTCVQAGAAAYLSAEALNSFVPDRRKVEYAAAYEQARKQAVRYLKSNLILDDYNL